MDGKTTRHKSHHRWRLVLLLLVLLPFLPEFVVIAVAAVAKSGGCLVNDNWVCLIAGALVSNIIAGALKVGVLVGTAMGDYLSVLVWLALCYLAIVLGWARFASRLLLGFVVTLIFAVLPYIGPLLSIAGLVNPKCQPNEGGVGRCIIFGGEVGAVAHDTVRPQLLMIGLLVAFAIFVMYVVAIIVLQLWVSKRPIGSAR